MMPSGRDLCTPIRWCGADQILELSQSYAIGPQVACNVGEICSLLFVRCLMALSSVHRVGAMVDPVGVIKFTPSEHRGS